MEKISYAVDCILSPLATGVVESVSYFSDNLIINVKYLCTIVSLFISVHVGGFLTIIANMLHLLSKMWTQKRYKEVKQTNPFLPSSAACRKDPDFVLSISAYDLESFYSEVQQNYCQPMRIMLS